MKSSAFALISFCLETVKSITSLASAVTLTIPAKANIFNVRQGTSPVPDGSNIHVPPSVYKFSAGTLGTACAVSLLGFATPAQAQLYRITTPDIKVVQYINDLDRFDCTTGLFPTIPVGSAAALCSALDVSANPQPPTSFTEESWERFKASQEYRGYTRIPSFSVFSDAENIISYGLPAEEEISYGFTPRRPLGDGYNSADVYTQTPYNRRESAYTGIGNLRSSVTVGDYRASRVSNPERVAQYALSGYDAPFVYTQLIEDIPANGSPINILVSRSEFPTTRLYINDELVDEKAQVSDLSDFFISGGDGRFFGLLPNLPGEGNFAPPGSGLSYLYTPQVTRLDDLFPFPPIPEPVPPIPEPSPGPLPSPTPGPVPTVPGSSQNNPILPTSYDNGVALLTGPSGAWFDPPLASGFQYSMTSDSLFTQILNFPAGIDADNIYEILVGGTSLGQFGSGVGRNSVNFISLLGAGVSDFTITGINPFIDTTNSPNFPLQLAFNTPTASFQQRVIPVPEPGTLGGLLLTSLSLAALSYAKRQKLDN